MSARPTVTYEGKTYSLRSTKTDIPDLDAMSRMGALVWLNRYTVARGYSRRTSVALPAITLVTR